MNACTGDKHCAGFQYVAAESLCKLLQPPPANVAKKVSLKKARKMAKKQAKKAVKKMKKKQKKKMKKALKSQKKAMAPKKKKPSHGQIYRESSKKLRLRQQEFKKAQKAANEAAKKA